MRQGSRYFISKHYGISKRFNEIHPARFRIDGLRIKGIYWNSHHKPSRFSGFHIGPITLGLVTGYRKYRIPFILFWYKDTFIVPVFLLGNVNPYLIVGKLEKPGIKNKIKQIWSKLKD